MKDCYRCDAVSMDALTQQVAVSYFVHGYWWYVTGVVPLQKDPREVDRRIIEKYAIVPSANWREIAARRHEGMANLQYIRCERFFVILATAGKHEFYEREARRIRCAKRGHIVRGQEPFPFAPLLVPRQAPGDSSAAPPGVFDGYSLTYQRGGFLRKSEEERAEYGQALNEWESETGPSDDSPKPRPGRGKRDPKWHACVKLERHTYQRLRAALVEISVHAARGSLEYHFQNTGYAPWQPIKQQLLRVLKQVNERRRTAGLHDQLSWDTVLKLERKQVAPFGVSKKKLKSAVDIRAA